MGHMKDKCWKRGKDGKASSTTNNYLEVLVDDEEKTLKQLNHLCGKKHDIFSRAKMPRRHLPIEAIEDEAINDRKAMLVEIGRGYVVRFKILTHFIKGKISLSPMETILAILRKLESVESLFKLAKKKRDEGLKSINLTKVERPPIVRRINIQKNSRNKTLHLLIELNDNLLEGLVDNDASMLIMFIVVVHELGIMHLVSRFEAYKTTSGMVIQAFG
jgi:hypothetical protein